MRSESGHSTASAAAIGSHSPSGSPYTAPNTPAAKEKETMAR